MNIYVALSRIVCSNKSNYCNDLRSQNTTCAGPVIYASNLQQTMAGNTHSDRKCPSKGLPT